MARFPMPPPGIDKFLREDCIVYPDTLEYDITANGYLASTVQGLFGPPPDDLPPLPGTFYNAGDQIGPLNPLVKQGQAMVVFFDTDNNQLYIDRLKISDKCP